MAVDKLVDSTQLDSDLTSVANAIRTKGGTSASMSFPTGFVSAIEEIPTGGGGNPTAENNDVIFIDYDGTIRYSYSAADFANLTALPDNPSHDGLTAEGWNWTLADAKSYVSSYGSLVIGQTYTTTDDKTHIYVTVPGIRKDVYIEFSSSGNADIDWGDGTITSGTGRLHHEYSDAGQYIISIYGDNTHNVNFCIQGNQGTYGNGLMGEKANASIYHYPMLKRLDANRLRVRAAAVEMAYSIGNVILSSAQTNVEEYTFANCYALNAVVFPPGVTINYSASRTFSSSGCKFVSLSKSMTLGTSATYVFSGCSKLKKVCIPQGTTKICSYTFSQCYALEKVVIPSTVTTLDGYAFQYCYSLPAVDLPNDLTTIGTYAFYNCYAMTKMTIPANVTSIGTYAFANCYGMKEYHFKRTTPPTLTNANTFNNIPSDCVIYVPSSALSTYQNASIWSNWSSKMVGE